MRWRIGKSPRRQKNPDINIPHYDSRRQTVYHPDHPDRGEPESFENFLVEPSKYSNVFKIIGITKDDQKIPIYGNGKNVRDWLFVLDHCDAILKIMFNGKSGESYNISAGNELDNLTIVKKILSLMGKSRKLISFVKDRPGHDFRYSMNSKKIFKEMKWKPTYDFDTGIEYTVNWYMNNVNWLKDSSLRNIMKTSWKTR